MSERKEQKAAKKLKALLEKDYGGKQPIIYCTYRGTHNDFVYLFYDAKTRVWDEDKLLYEEAIRKYPKDKYEWIKLPN